MALETLAPSPGSALCKTLNISVCLLSCKMGMTDTTRLLGCDVPQYSKRTPSSARCTGSFNVWGPKAQEWGLWASAVPKRPWGTSTPLDLPCQPGQSQCSIWVQKGHLVHSHTQNKQPGRARTDKTAALGCLKVFRSQVMVSGTGFRRRQARSAAPQPLPQGPCPTLP